MVQKLKIVGEIWNRLSCYAVTDQFADDFVAENELVLEMNVVKLVRKISTDLLKTIDQKPPKNLPTFEPIFVSAFGYVSDEQKYLMNRILASAVSYCQLEYRNRIVRRQH